MRLAFALLAAARAALAAAPPGLATDLRINYLINPRGVDDAVAVFTWRLPQDRGDSAASPQQLAARVVVVAAADGVVAFDSGMAATDQPQLVNSPPFAPMALRSDAIYSWWVEVQTASAVVRSDNATFATGVLTQPEWAAAGARWIRGGSGSTQMRKDFVVPAGAPVARATIFVAACQYYTLLLDGAVVGDQRLDSPWTEFYTNRSYTTFDVDVSLVAPGPHALGLRVGQGFCAETAHDEFQPDAERSAIVLLQLHGADGVVRVVSDGSWTSSSSPIQSDSTYYGEVYDAREEQPGWAEPSFVPPAGKSWGPVDTNISVVAWLKSQAMPPIKVVREIPAVSMTRVPINYTGAPCVANVPEGQPASVACPNSAIEAVVFVSFGLPTGDCSAGVAPGTCGTAANLTAAVQAVCVGQASCSVTCTGRVPPPYPNGQCTIENGSGASVKFVEGEPCGPVVKRTSLTVVCAPPAPNQPRFKFVYDFGQEFAGVVRLTLPPGTPAGTQATLKHAEVLAHEPLAPADGSVYMGNLFWSNPVDVYIAEGSAGGVSEVYEPSFTYHGFRYVELILEPAPGAGAPMDPPEPVLASVMGLNLRSSVAEAASLSFGSDSHAPGNLLQRLSNNSWWTEAAALMSIPAGAAARGERNGWTGDAAFASESECVDFDTGAFFRNYLAMVVDAQAPNGELGGGVPDQGTSPTTTHHYQETPMDPSWSAVFPVVAFNLWKYYNCAVCLDRAWPGLTLYYDMLYKNYSVSPTTFAKWGDWNPASPPPGRAPDGSGPPYVRTVSSITAAAMVVQSFDEAAELALATGRAAEAAQYATWLAEARAAYHASFYDPLGGVYGDSTPTAFAAALAVGAVPDALLPAVVSRFVWQLSSTGYSLETMGFIGVRLVFEALARVNRTDVALRMLNRTAYPSFGYQITNDLEPATSLWECQDAPTMHQWVDESSRDHHYSTSINTFLRKFLAGLDQPRGSAAWAVVKCRPEAALLPTLLPAAAAAVRTARGLVGCSWSAAPVAGGLLPPPPPPPPPPGAPAPPVFCAVTPMFTGAVRGPSPMVLQCPAGAVVANVTYARWGVSVPAAPWFCWGPQPPPPGRCESDVRHKIAPLCVGRAGCSLSAVATQAALGGPCSGDQQLIVRVECTGVTGAAGEGATGAPPPAEPGTTWAVVNATVPGGSTGEVHVPLLSAVNGTITESGAVVWRAGEFVPGAAAGVTGGGADGRFAWFFTRSGIYSFQAVT